METRPINAFVLSLLAGMFVLLGVLLGVVFTPNYGYAYATVPSYYYPFLISSAVSGAVMLLAAVLLYQRPALHVTWGVVILVLSVASAIGAVTGYYALFGLVGVVLGVIGGAIGVGWRTSPEVPFGAFGPARMCPGCGRYVPLAYPFCGFCGTPAPAHQPTAIPPGQPPRT